MLRRSRGRQARVRLAEMLIPEADPIVGWCSAPPSSLTIGPSAAFARDRHILRLIRWHRVLTTSQVQMMFFSDRNTAQHRMTRLYQLRLVERFRPPRAGHEAEYHDVAAGRRVHRPR